MGQGDLNNYVKFLKLNSINSNQELVAGVSYTFAVETTDENVTSLVDQGVVFSSLDSEARVDFEIGDEGMKIYGESITIYGHRITVYGS